MEIEAQSIEAAAAARRALRQMRRRARVARVRAIEQAIGSAISETVRAGIAVGGAGLVSYGAWTAWTPAGFVVLGALLLAGVWLHDKHG